MLLRRSALILSIGAEGTLLSHLFTKMLLQDAFPAVRTQLFNGDAKVFG